MSKKKPDEINTHEHKIRRIIYVITFVFIAVLFALSASFFVTAKNRVKGTQLPMKTETPYPAPSSTPIYLETPPPQSEFYDTFKNNAQGWSVSSTAGYYRTLKPGELMLTNTNPGTMMVESLPTNSLFDNCTVTIDFTIINISLDDSIGVYVRGDTNLEHDYRIDINGNGTFDVAKEYLDPKNNPQSALIVGPKSIPLLKPPGKRNAIALTMDGSQLQLYINNEKVDVVKDADYTAGQVALFARLGESPQNVVVSFSRVEIDKISGTIDGAVK